ncbi:YcgL domain-containing protein [Endothiovibrio diazotrophicus]
MKCAIYKSLKKDEMYLYVERRDDFSRVPDALMGVVGRLEFVMELELTAERRLAREDADEVRRNLSEQGFHLQMPPKDLLTHPISYH